LAEFVERVRGHARIAGLLQVSSREANGRPRMEMIDIESGQTIRISQNLGANSRACCVDVNGMAEAATFLRRAIQSQPDLLVINKFSGLEAKGGGLRGEFLEALAQDLPLVTGLSRGHQSALLEMTGGEGRFLDASIEALEAWWRESRANLQGSLDRRPSS
jgi:nucleoside-triphosphatase THEP1